MSRPAASAMDPPRSRALGCRQGTPGGPTHVRRLDQLFPVDRRGVGLADRLLFIVATLSAGREREQTMQGTAIYTTPTVVMLAVVLTFSGAAMAPGLGAPFAGLLLVAAGAIGVIYGAWTVRRIRRWNLGEAPHWSDVWCYAAAPMALYAALAGAGVLVWLDRPAATAACAMVLILMLLMAIRDAWDLVTWLAPKAVR